MWVVVRFTRSKRLVEAARKHAREQEHSSKNNDIPDWKKLTTSREGWRQVTDRYIMEWKVVWKDVTVGFTVAEIIAVYVPEAFFRMFLSEVAQMTLNSGRSFYKA